MRKRNQTQNTQRLETNHIIIVACISLFLFFWFINQSTPANNDFYFHYSKSRGEINEMGGRYDPSTYEDYPPLLHITVRIINDFKGTELTVERFKGHMAALVFILFPLFFLLLFGDYWKTIALFSIGLMYASWYSSTFPQVLAIVLFAIVIKTIDKEKLNQQDTLSLGLLFALGFLAHNKIVLGMAFLLIVRYGLTPLAKTMLKHVKWPHFPAIVFLQKRTLTDPLLIDPFTKMIPLPLLWRNKKGDWKLLACLALIPIAFFFEYRFLHFAAILAVINLNTHQLPNRWKLVIGAHAIFQFAFWSYALHDLYANLA